MTDENYNFLHGLPTEHCGSWSTTETCTTCRNLTDTWRTMTREGATWTELRALECTSCGLKRERRARLLAKNDIRIRQEPFVTAPYIHKNNQPKYHAMLLRAAEDAKKNEKSMLSGLPLRMNPWTLRRSPKIQTNLGNAWKLYCNFMNKKLRAFLE